MLRVSFFCLLALGTLLPLVADAQVRDQGAIPADVHYVVTGGRWSDAGRSGVYRVVVRTGGMDHVVSEVHVEWISTDTTEPQVLLSKKAPTGSWRLDNPRFRGQGRSWRVEIEALETHFTPPVRGTWVLRLGVPGQLSTTHLHR
jgi:hypothetical protein